MRLSDIMSAAGLSFYAQVALVVFFVTYIAIVIRTFAPSRTREMDEAARLPLDDDHAIPRQPVRR